MKKTISLFLAIIYMMSLLCSTSFAAVADLSAYALDGYYNKQLKNGWAEVSISDSTDANGVITSTASYSGELGSGKRIATFQPWETGKGVGSKADSNYTMHFGFTVNEITSPMKINFSYKNANTSKDVISFSDKLVVWGNSINENDTHIEVSLPYTIDFYIDIKTLVAYIYVNNQFFCEEWVTGRNDTTWNEVRVLSLESSNNIKLVTTKAECSIYNANVSFQDVVKAYTDKGDSGNSGYILDSFDFDDSTAAGETEFWVSGSHSRSVEGTTQTISGTGNTSNSNAIFYGLKKNGTYTAVPIFDSAGDDKIFRISFEFTNKQSADANMQLGFNPLNSSNGSNGRNYIYKFNLKDGAITSVNGSTAKVSAPVGSTVKVNMLMNLKTGASRLYVGKNSYISNGNVFQTSGRNLKSAIFWVDQAVSYNYQLKDLTFTVYSAEANMDDIAADAYANDEEIVVPEQMPFETDANGYGDFEVEDYEECYNPDAWYIYENRRVFSNSKALGVISENKTAPSATEEPTLNLSFKANKSGKNTYYAWIRHTASVANQSGQNCYLSKTESGSYTTFTFSAEKNAPQWICLGSVELNEGENGYFRIRHRQQNHIAVDRYVITTDSDFVPTDAYYGISPANSSTAYSVPATSFSNGRVSFEAEATTYTSPFKTYSMMSHMGTYGSSSNFSGKNGLITSSSDSKSFTSEWTTTPHIEFNFTPPTSGTKFLWARMLSTSLNKDIAISVNCSEYKQFSPTTEDKWYWQLINVIDGAQANLPINVRLYNVSGGYGIDMFAISESVFDTPTDKISWTSTSNILPSSYPVPEVSAEAVKAMSHPRIYFTKDEVASVKSTLKASENSSALSAHNSNVSRGKNNNFTGSLAVVPGYANNSSLYLGVIESLALEYAINGDITAGRKAVKTVSNYVATVSYAGIASDEFSRVAGHDIATLSRIYDWCYDLLTVEQKNAIIKRCEELAYQLEIGWPPKNLSAVTGFGAEGVLQNYLLTFAIAVADERPDIYNYILGRIENEYLPAKEIMNGSGENLQGTRYGTYRGQHDLTAALLLSTIGYEKDVYGQGLEEFVNLYIYARRPDGLVFVDGDDTNNGKTAGKYYSVGHMQYSFVVAARLFGNPYYKNEAKKVTNNFSEFNYGESYLSPASFLAINRPSVSMKEPDGYPLSKFFGYPNGNMIARTGWSNTPSVTDNTAVAFMKTSQVNVSNHQHLDAGNFQLYYKGILANDPTYYTGTNYNSEYMNLYAKRSVAHNTVLVRDGVSRTLNGHSIADGGQVPVDTPDKASDIKQTATTEAYDFGGDDVNRPDYSYLKSDLTGAYSSSSVNDYNRSFIFLNMYDEESPAALVVFDRLSTRNASHSTAWLLHGLNAPQINGSRSVFTLNSNGYTGKMTNDTLLPANAKITTVEDGYVTAGGTKYASGYNTASSGVNESEGYRIEVSPSEQSTLTYYLNVIQLGDSDKEAVKPTLIENDTFAGAVVNDRVVLFSKSGELLGNDTYSFNFTAKEGYLCKIAVADVAEGTWEILYSKTGAEGTFKALSHSSTSRIGEDKGATISFTGMSGYYSLRKVSDAYTSRTTEICEENSIKQLSPQVKVENDKLYVAPRTYDSIFGVSNGTYSYKQMVAVYNKEDGRLISAKIIDNFTKTDRFGEYYEVAGTDKLGDGVIVKTFLFEDLEDITPVADSAAVTYR